MREGFMNYFGMFGLDATAPRKAVYEQLRQRYAAESQRRSQEAKINTQLLAHAMEVFADDGRYAAYVSEYRAYKEEMTDARPDAEPAPDAGWARRELEREQQAWELEQQRVEFARVKAEAARAEAQRRREQEAAAREAQVEREAQALREASAIRAGSYRLVHTKAEAMAGLMPSDVRVELKRDGNFLYTFQANVMGMMNAGAEATGRWQYDQHRKMLTMSGTMRITQMNNPGDWLFNMAANMGGMPPQPLYISLQVQKHSAGRWEGYDNEGNHCVLHAA